MAALPDGRALSASDDKTLRLWDLASGQCLRVLKGHSVCSVKHVAVLPYGRALSASSDYTLRFWDLASGECLRVLEGHSEPGPSRRGAARWARPLGVMKHDTLRLWDLASGQCLRVLEGHSGSVNHVVALPDGRALSASSDDTLRLWDLASGPVPARPGGAFRSGRSRRGAARRAGPLGVRRQHPAASGTSPLGQCLRVLEGHSGTGSITSWRCPTGAPSRRQKTRA